MKEICSDLIRKVARAHASKCSNTTSFNLAEQSYNKMTELTSEIRAIYKGSANGAAIESIMQRVEEYMGTDPIVHDS